MPFIVTIPAKKVAKGAAQGQGSQTQSVEVDQEQLCTKVEMLMISPEANKSFDPVKGVDLAVLGCAPPESSQPGGQCHGDSEVAANTT